MSAARLRESIFTPSAESLIRSGPDRASAGSGTSGAAAMETAMARPTSSRPLSCASASTACCAFPYRTVAETHSASGVGLGATETRSSAPKGSKTARKSSSPTSQCTLSTLSSHDRGGGGGQRRAAGKRRRQRDVGPCGVRVRNGSRSTTHPHGVVRRLRLSRRRAFFAGEKAEAVGARPCFLGSFFLRRPFHLPRRVFLRLARLDHDHLVPQDLARARQRGLHGALLRELDVCHALARGRVPVVDDAHVVHRPRRGEELEDLPLIRLRGQVVGEHRARVPLERLQLATLAFHLALLPSAFPHRLAIGALGAGLAAVAPPRRPGPRSGRPAVAPVPPSASPGSVPAVPGPRPVAVPSVAAVTRPVPPVAGRGRSLVPVAFHPAVVRGRRVDASGRRHLPDDASSFDRSPTTATRRSRSPTFPLEMCVRADQPHRSCFRGRACRDDASRDGLWGVVSW